MRGIRVLAALLALFVVAGAAAAQPVNTGHLVAELVPARQGVAPGQTVHVALRQDIRKGWHTYWRNPGDSGEPTRIAWTLPAGWKAGEIVWPAPSRQPTGPLMNYGYSGEVLLPVAITAPADARPGQTIALKAAAAFLVCEEICVPEEAALTLALPVTAAPAPPDPKWGARIAATLAAAPRPAGLTAAFTRADGRVSLAVAGPPLSGVDAAGAYFFPFDGTQIEHARPQGIERGPQGLTLSLPPGFAFTQGDGPAEMAGVLTLAGKAFEIAARPGPSPLGASGLGPPPPRVTAAPDAGADLGLALAVLLAFAGGLILNLMPCVFPILAMKTAAFAGHAHQTAQARRQGLAFAAGVMATFLGLAALIVSLKAGGAAVGWGFQLQSPPVVAGLALLMLAVALNLSGVFEAGLGLQGVGGGLAARSGLTGAFFTGALAVVVAAPCTAPFMAPALGWALTQNAAAALAVFAALGLGFAAPFVALAFAPGLLARLPRPGPWMDVLRKVLAFPMYGAAAWLVWVLSVQAGDIALARVLAAAVVLAFGAWMLGRAQRRTMEGRGPVAVAVAGALAVGAAIAAALWPGYDAAAARPGEAARAIVPYEPWSPERVAAARAAGRPVLVDFTAAWCVTCQVNERLAIDTRRTAEAFRRTGAVYLKADWTRKDPVIAAELARHGRAGVPLYLVYGARSGDGVILPQILTEDLVIRALEDAQKR